jgi:hypothetical protein
MIAVRRLLRISFLIILSVYIGNQKDVTAKTGVIGLPLLRLVPNSHPHIRCL